eukprot:scaffold329923_cov24-Prasinocladus_malaysianus.AAC.1
MQTTVHVVMTGPNDLICTALRGFLPGGCGAACIATDPLGVLKTPLPGAAAARAGGGLPPAGLGL